ncbi:MAG: thioredoxin-disulfide reductase [Muribaculaceae bacterium]|nr:thioredoxin-disulfide reductase [Muribaculaceae bacterium]
MSQENTKVLIIGSGPAGYTAGIYASRANLKPLLFEGQQPGGQLTQTTEIENFPGYPNGIQGPDMMNELREQAVRFGTEIRNRIIESVDTTSRPFKCVDERGDIIMADTVIVATGASAKYLGLDDEEKYRGMGVSACATCDGFFYRKKKVAVVGGGDTACEEALYLSTICSKVFLIVRKDYLRASDVMRRRVSEKENITILFNCNTVGLFGEDGVEGAKIVEHKGTNKEQIFDIEIDGFFLAIGHKPNTDMFRDKLALDSEGYIETFNGTQQTSVEGIFAAGDCCDPRYRQAVVAAGSGCRAALDAEKYLMEHEEM